MDTIKKISLSCCDVPTVYSNKQSYYECLCYLGYKIDECINAINAFNDDYKTYTDNAVATLKAQLVQQILEFQHYIDEKIAVLTVYVDEQDSELDSKIQALESSLNDKISELTSLVYQLNEYVYTYINTEISKLYKYIETYYVDNVKMYNPTNGKLESISTVVNDVYDRLRYFAVTTSGFDELELTCNEFESLNLQAQDFDLLFNIKYGKPDYLYMFNPFNGKWTYYQDIISYLCTLHMESPFTVTEFDGKTSATCTALDNLKWDAFDIDNNGLGWITATS